MTHVNDMRDLKLSLLDTNVLKGIALLLLLVHHLFYIKNGLYNDILIANDHYLVHSIGIWCKLCVAIFVFLSGYGLTIGALKSSGISNIKQFYWHRFSKLLLNYWFIWLCFVPISILVFDRTLVNAYGSHIVPKLVLDFFGLINCLGIYGYNATWWFYSCIIVLYLIFPMLYKLMKYNPWMLLPLSFAIYFLPIPSTTSIRIYFPCFIMGMAYSKFNQLIKITPPQVSSDYSICHTCG